MYEKLPATINNQPFPVGDIVNSRLADEYCHMVDNDDWDDLLSYADQTYAPIDTDTWTMRMNHLMAEQLCVQWDYDNNGNNFAKTGFKLARSLIRTTDMLPSYDAELRMTLIHMKQLTTAKNFATAAWCGMRYSHPRVHAYHERLLTRATDQLNLGAGNNTEVFIAGLSLPYTLSVISSMSHTTNSIETASS